MKKSENQISFFRAREIVQQIDSGGTESVELSFAAGRIAATDIFATIDSPASSTSLKDGYAVISSDICSASRENPITLQIKGTVLAGDAHSINIKSGEASRIMTGATIPKGATAVLASEFAMEGRSTVTACADAPPGKNILARGGELSAGQLLAKQGQRITPAIIGLLAASGISRVEVFRSPRVALLATGSEIVPQGTALMAGQIFQSNQYVTLSWLRHLGIHGEIFIIRDNFDSMAEMVQDLLPKFDVIVTSGGLLSGDRDLVLPVMEQAGTEYIFKRVKMGPGKGVCFGSCGHAAIFNLPGGPPSNYLAFMLIALPGIMRIAGLADPFLPMHEAILLEAVGGRRDWTQFAFASRSWNHEVLQVTPCDPGSRLMKIALSDCVIEVPEGTGRIEAGAPVKIHDFSFYAS